VTSQGRYRAAVSVIVPSGAAASPFCLCPAACGAADKISGALIPALDIHHLQHNFFRARLMPRLQAVHRVKLCAALRPERCLSCSS